MCPLYFCPCLASGQASAGNSLEFYVHSTGYLYVSLHFELMNDNGAKYNSAGAVIDIMS